MSTVKDVIIETVKRMPEISDIFEHLEELSDEERQKLISLIPEVKISDKEKKRYTRY